MRDDPYLWAITAFYAEPTSLNLGEVIMHHATGEYSYFVRTATSFLLAREVGRDWSKDEVVDETWNSEDSTLLHVTLFAGELSELVPMIPEHIEEISFQRRGYELRRISVERLRSLSVRLP